MLLNELDVKLLFITMKQKLALLFNELVINDIVSAVIAGKVMFNIC